MINETTLDGFTELRLHIEPSTLVVFQAIVESYEGLATLSTADRETGEVILYTPLELAATCKKIIMELRKELDGPDAR